MILQIIEWMLGTTGRSLLEFIKNNPVLFNILAITYLLFLGLGHLQLRNIKKKTENLTIEIAKNLISGNQDISVIDIFNTIKPVWMSNIASWAYFIPHRLEFYVVKATQENVLIKFQFSPEWVEKLLISRKVLNP